jgi:pimeloyl-ACP methyl ester carboxylesterase
MGERKQKQGKNRNSSSIFKQNFIIGGNSMKLSAKQKIHCLFMVLFTCIFLLSLNSGFSQVNKLDVKNLEETMRNPWKPGSSVFLQDWLILGSIPISGLGEIDKDFLASFGGEANARPIEGQTVKISDSDFKWITAKCTDIFDLIKFFQRGRTDNAMAYAYTTINRKEAGKVYLTLGSDDGVKVWLNGKLVHRMTAGRSLTLDEDGFVADMNAGENHLLLKISQATGGWGFAVRMVENPHDLNFIRGIISFTVIQESPKGHILTIHSQGNLDQALLEQKVKMEAYTTGGKMVAKKTFNCNQPVVLDYKNWSDGVYEIRFSYENIDGVAQTKYLTWYKGDILATAHEVVNSAPPGNIRTLEASTHRMLADMILNRLGNNIENPDSSRFASLHSPLMEFAEIKANKQVRPGGFVRLTYIDDIDNTPQFCRCYLPINYDPAKKWPMVIYLHGYNGDNPEYYSWWDVDKRHHDLADKHNVIFIEPHGRGNTQYLGIGDRDVLRCIQMAKQKLSVDDDRVYLTGGSMGGWGTWNVGTRHPELFATIAPIYGGDDYHVGSSEENIAKMSAWDLYVRDKSSSSSRFESLLNMPILVSHGDKDQSVDINYSRYLVRLLQRWDYDIRYIEVPGRGHEDLGIWDTTIPWMLQHKRVSAPRHVRVRAGDLRTASAYWVKVDQRIDPREFIVVDAEALQGNIIQVDSKNACELSLTPDKILIDYSKPIRIVWNGKLSTLSGLKPEKITLREDGYKHSLSQKTPQISGPISDFENTPFMIVIGTISTDSMMNREIGQKAALLINRWKQNQKYEPRSMKDTEVTDAELEKYSLLLLGGPAENKVSRKIFDKIPFQITDSTITIDGRPFKAKDAVLHAVYPNPYNNERYINIVAATSGAGFYFYNPFVGDLSEFDYCIVDGKIPVYSLGATSAKIQVATGFFDHDWKINDTFLNAGEENLRSKCAYTLVNKDLSTEIVSKTRPSVEIMKSFEGTYQLNPNTELRVFLANDTLKITQGSFSAQLLATADSEFYLNEFHVSLLFRKNMTTNDYEMVIHQNGMEIIGRKVH